MDDPTLEKLIGTINVKIANANIANSNFTLDTLCSGREADDLDFEAKRIEKGMSYRLKDVVVLNALRLRLSSGLAYLKLGENKNAAYSFDWASKSANGLRLNDLKIILLENAANLFYESGEMRCAIWAYARMAEYYAKTEKWSKSEEALNRAKEIAKELKQDPFSIMPYFNAMILAKKFKPPESSLPAYVAK